MPCLLSSESDTDTDSAAESESGAESKGHLSTPDISASEDGSLIQSIDFDDPFNCSDYSPNSAAEDHAESLYPSSTTTVIEALAILFSWFYSSPGLSKESFSRLLYILNAYLLPSGNVLPTSYHKARTIIDKNVVPVKEFHCCVNDCVLFRNSSCGQYEKCDVCPKCGEPRYQPVSKTPRKRFSYIPLLPRLKRMFASRNVSQLLQGHLSCSDNKTGSVMHDIHQSPAWISKYSKDGSFQGDHRGVALALCTDGMNPFSITNVQYSMWPITMTILNLPRNIRNTAGSMLLSGIIPGRSEPKTMDPYVDILVEELIEINGLELFDAFRDENFPLKAEIVLHILDYPGQSKVFHCQGTYEYYCSCITCNRSACA